MSSRDSFCVTFVIVWTLIQFAVSFVRDRIRRMQSARGVRVTIDYDGWEVSSCKFNCEIESLSKVIGTPIGDNWEKIVIEKIVMENEPEYDAKLVHRKAVNREAVN